MAWRAGARCFNMEYIQFHPTTLFNDWNNKFKIKYLILIYLISLLLIPFYAIHFVFTFEQRQKSVFLKSDMPRMRPKIECFSIFGHKWIQRAPQMPQRSHKDPQRHNFGSILEQICSPKCKICSQFKTKDAQKYPQTF